MRPAPFALERFFAQHEFDVPHLLCASDCETMTVDELCALEPGMRARLGALNLGYADARGAAKLRDLIARGYGTIRPDEVLVHAGAQEAIHNFVHAVLQPGDEVIVHFPAYQSLHEL